MQGKVLTFSVQTGQGIISGNDEKRYSFQGSEWRAERAPSVGLNVDFEVVEGKAVEIYSVVSKGESSGVSKRLITALLALFVGSLGIHKFYLGRTQAGVIMLVVFVVGFIFAGVPSFVIAIIGFIEALIYFSASDESFEQIYVTNQKAWF